MKCTRCQQNHPAQAQFCLYCGVPLDSSAASASYAEQRAEIDRLRHALAEGAEQQAATTEILQVISRSPSNLQPVLDAIVASAVRLLEADSGLLTRIAGDQIEIAALTSTDPAGDAILRAAYPLSRHSDRVHARVIRDRAPLNVADAQTDPRLPDVQHATARARGYRSHVAVPLLRHDEALGAIAVTRHAPGGFTDDEIALLETFADQAVIAIENVRLFNELQHKNEALTEAHAQVNEALERQTATSEILGVIASSPTDVQPVFDAIARHAVALCDGIGGIVVRYDGAVMRLGAYHNVSTQSRVRHETEYPRSPDRTIPLGVAILDRTIVHVPNLQASTQFAGSPVQRSGRGSMIGVPLLRHGEAIGAIGITRDDPEGFSGRDIALLETFADQAVIAIENVRLFNELQDRNRALTQAHGQVTEALERQTATSEILGVISSSPTDVQPVFESLVPSAARLCKANDVLVLTREGNTLRPVAGVGEFWGSLAADFRVPLVRGSVAARSVIDRATLHIADLAVASEADFSLGRDLQRRFRHHTVLAVPLVREGVALGTIFAMRFEVRPFEDQEIALLKTFADQAVIAIENVRLFSELQHKNAALTEALEQQTATSDILRVISQSQTDLQPVFDSIIRNSVRLCGASHGGVYRFDGELVHSVAHDGYSPEHLQQWRSTWPKPVTASSVACAAIRTRSPFRIGDFETDPMRLMLGPETRENLRSRGSRSVMAVPMLRHGDVIGVISLAHRDVDAFSDTHVELLKTFADQAVIAIENVRLFTELESANRALTAASQHKSEFLANMSHELRTPLNAVIGFSEVLNERMFGELNEKQEEYLKDIHASGQHLLSLINDILDLSKIEAGRMELEPTDFDLASTLDNALTLVRERAGRRSIAVGLTVDERLGQIKGDERKIRQVLLNLLSNAIKFTPEGGRIDVRAVPVDGSVEVSVSDTGVGIAPGDQDAIFEEFKQVGTAEKKVEGTGLGLALSRKFIELHGGRMWVKSQIGEGSTFTFTIPPHS